MTERRTALAQLVAIHMANGMTSTGQLAAETGYSERAILKAKWELQGRKSELGCGTRVRIGTPVPISDRNPGADRNPSSDFRSEPGCVSEPECGTRVRGTDIAPARAQNESFQDSSLIEKTRERFVGKFVILEGPEVSKLSEYYEALKFPADLIAADLYLAGQRKGIDFSTHDSRIGQLHTYLARRNRESDRKPKVSAAPDWKRQMEIDAGVRL